MTGKVVVRVLLVLVSIFVTFSVSAAADNFKYEFPVIGEVKKGAIYSVHLSEAVLKNCNAGCKDLRLFDESENEVPYVVLTDERNDRVQKYGLKVMGYEVKDGTSVITIELPDKFKSISIIEMNIADRDFTKSVELYGSVDKLKWDHIRNDNIYDFSSQIDMRKTSIEFDRSDFKYYKLVLKNPKEDSPDMANIKLKYKDLQFSVDGITSKKVRINSLNGKTGREDDRTITYDQRIFTQYSRKETEDRDTAIIVHAKLPLSKITFDVTNTYYFRSIAVYVSDTGEEDSYRYLKGSNLYSFPLSGEIETNNSIKINTPSHNYYKFVIKNGNNPTLAIKEISFKWIRKRLYFVALGDSNGYKMRLSDPELNKPDYDLIRFINQQNWHELDTTQLSLGAPVLNKEYSPVTSKEKKQKIEKFILTAVILLLIMIIGVWLYMLMKKAGKT